MYKRQKIVYYSDKPKVINYAEKNNFSWVEWRYIEAGDIMAISVDTKINESVESEILRNVAPKIIIVVNKKPIKQINVVYKEFKGELPA